MQLFTSHSVVGVVDGKLNFAIYAGYDPIDFTDEGDGISSSVTAGRG
jgi:hypothetical protein